MTMPSKNICLFTAALFFVLAFIVYGSSAANNGFVSWDDKQLILENPIVHDTTITNIAAAFTSYDPELYIPLTLVSYQINHSLGGLDAFGFHFTDLVLHTMNALLVALLFWLLFHDVLLACFLGLVFLTHPLNTETVAWASARKDTLSTLFYLSALISYIHFRAFPATRSLLGVFFFFLLGLLSKVMIITLPVVLILFDLYEGRKDYKKILYEKVPLIILAVIFGIVALSGKATVLVTTTTVQKVLMAALSTLYYIGAFVVPHDLSPMYPFNEAISITHPILLASLLTFAVLCGLVFVFRKKYPWLLFGSLLYFVTLLPTFTNFAKGGEVYLASDRYAYIPMIGLLFVIGSLLQILRRGKLGRYLPYICASVLVALSVLANSQATVWASSESLYIHTLKNNPGARAAINNLGMERFAQNRYQEAIELFDKALEIRVDAYTLVNKGSAFERMGDLATALAVYKSAMKMDPALPDPYYSIGSIASKQGMQKEAIVFYKKAIELKPDYVNALNNLGAIYLQSEEWDSAIGAFSQAVREKPDFASAYYNLGGAYEGKRDLVNAKKAYVQSIAVEPRSVDAMLRLATILLSEGSEKEAHAILRKVLEIDPTNKVAVDTLSSYTSER